MPVGCDLGRAISKPGLPVAVGNGTRDDRLPFVVLTGKLGNEGRDGAVSQIEVWFTHGRFFAFGVAARQHAFGDEVDVCAVFAFFVDPNHAQHVCAFARQPFVRQIFPCFGQRLRFGPPTIVELVEVEPPEFSAFGVERILAVGRRRPELCRPFGDLGGGGAVLTDIDVAGVQIGPEDTRSVGGDDMAEVGVRRIRLGPGEPNDAPGSGAPLGSTLTNLNCPPSES